MTRMRCLVSFYGVVYGICFLVVKSSIQSLQIDCATRRHKDLVTMHAPHVAVIFVWNVTIVLVKADKSIDLEK